MVYYLLQVRVPCVALHLPLGFAWPGKRLGATKWDTMWYYIKDLWFYHFVQIILVALSELVSSEITLVVFPHPLWS